MVVCIVSKEIGILAIFILSLLLCSITSTNLVDEGPAEIRADTENQTVIIEHSSQVTDSVVSESIPEKLPNENIPIIETNASVISTENISNEILSSTADSFIVVDNRTNDESQQTATTTASTKKNLSNINSFEEWKQQQLHADLSRSGRTSSQNSIPSETSTTISSKGTSSSTNLQQNPSTINLNKKGKLRKNFASASCGAKLLAHNVEAQNVPSILSSSPDEYMLNPCNAKIWFVIELCESIRIFNIEIANFELFSSVPKTFRVSASDRYPTKDWHRQQLGTFNASNNRTIQSFQTLALATYLKYVKFELLDFHGHEHYCPLSVVRVHGSNVEDEIMTMEDNTNLVDSKGSVDIQDGIDNDDDDDDANESNDQQVGGIIGSAILDLAKRVFRRPAVRDTLSTTSHPTTSESVLKPDCHRTGLNSSIINDTMNSWHRSDTFKQCIAKFLVGLWSKFDTCTIYLSQICFDFNYCCQCPLIQTNISDRLINTTNDRRISTLNIYANPCGYYHILTNQFICKKEKIIEVNKTISTHLNGDITRELIEKNITFDKNETMTMNNETENTINNQSISNLNSSTIVSENQTHSITNRSNNQSSPTHISDEQTLIIESQILSNKTNESSSQSFSSESSNIDLDIPEQSIETNIIDETSAPTETATVPSNLFNNNNNNNNNEVIPPLLSSPWLKGMLVNTKSIPELFKIIEKLNFNLTLSNRYLQELSQHYVKKLDETQQTTDLLLKASKSADEKFEYLEDQLYKLQENFTDVSYRLIKLEAWIPLIVTIIFCLFIWSLWTTCRLMRVRRKLKFFIAEYEKLRTVKQIEKDDDEDDDDVGDSPILCNGMSKRKLSTDSSDSVPSRSQRVPDLTLSKIQENVIEKTKHETKRKSSNPTRHLLPLSTI